jgi:F-type H+-transporting ATPase subunit b
MIVLAFAENSVQLVPDGTIFLHIAIILVMIWVLNRILFKPINRILDERERRTTGRLKEAREILLRADRALAEYEAGLRGARAEGYRWIEEQRAEAMRSRTERLNAVREEVFGWIEEEKTAILAQKEASRVVLAATAREAALEIGAHILHRPISGASIPIGEI